ncbi:hypothetical protein [Nocardiopsis metallicus]|uniref:Uncharacterized protein n=1 Tax=Nocardiopsis metallicus TaxID=179819 RepID=A0A840WIT9_9ACTN|nr:hypothetical protein [Nocardiopsis metallicus]MBB5489988.1 hypothetical protein [Nocardiopsis metallicus]
MRPTPGGSRAREMGLAGLHEAGEITPRDVDVVSVAFGQISYEGVDALLRRRDGDTEPLVEDFEAAVRRVVRRINECQHHDGGSTSIRELASDHCLLEVGGPCVHCPQIIYTMGVVAEAIRCLWPGDEQVEFTGTRFEEKTERPPGAQLTMAMVMRGFSLTFAQIDVALRQGPVNDERLEELAGRSHLLAELRAGR